MVPILAKQAVIIKCTAQSGIIISNYECAYAMGILAKLADKEVAELSGEVQEQPDEPEEAGGKKPEKEKEATGGKEPEEEETADERPPLAGYLQQLLMQAAGYRPENEREEQLLVMLQNYKPDETMDDQIRLLYKMGYEERELWKR